jgi:hypothetical protein
METIDASAVSTGLGHSTSFETRTVVEDIYMLLKEKIPAREGHLSITVQKRASIGASPGESPAPR